MRCLLSLLCLALFSLAAVAQPPQCQCGPDCACATCKCPKVAAKRDTTWDRPKPGDSLIRVDVDGSVWRGDLRTNHWYCIRSAPQAFRPLPYSTGLAPAFGSQMGGFSNFGGFGGGSGRGGC